VAWSRTTRPPSAVMPSGGACSVTVVRRPVWSSRTIADRIGRPTDWSCAGPIFWPANRLRPRTAFCRPSTMRTGALVAGLHPPTEQRSDRAVTQGPEVWPAIAASTVDRGIQRKEPVDRGQTQHGPPDGSGNDRTGRRFTTRRRAAMEISGQSTTASVQPLPWNDSTAGRSWPVDSERSAQSATTHWYPSTKRSNLTS
jgi:hypothetical protein